jgi:predicted phage-related endonuclease
MKQKGMKMHIGDMEAAGLLDHGPDWHSARALGVGGSDAVKIAKGVREELEVLRLEKLGRQASDDLTKVLPVQMGSWTEPLNRLWLSYAIGKPVLPGSPHIHPEHAFMRANIDGFTGGPNDTIDIVECKHCNSFTKFDDALVRYFPQLQHNMAVFGAQACYLSVFIGSDRHEWRRVDRDEDYIANLIKVEQVFWNHVVMDIEIDSAKTIAAPELVPPTRDVDMSKSNSWAANASSWLMLRDQAKEFEKAAKDLKALMEPDMRRGYGHGIEIVKDGRGCTIKELKAKKEAA